MADTEPFTWPTAQGGRAPEIHVVVVPRRRIKKRSKTYGRARKRFSKQSYSLSSKVSFVGEIRLSVFIKGKHCWLRIPPEVSEILQLLQGALRDKEKVQATITRFKVRRKK